MPRIEELLRRLERLTLVKHAPTVTHVTADYFKGGFEIDLERRVEYR